MLFLTCDMNRRKFIVFLAIWFCFQCLAAQSRGNLNFLVVSDLGNYGGGDQRKIAQTLGDFADRWSPNAILNLGDTFHYWGVQSVDDPGWNSNFESIYTSPSLHNLWFSALGNHDYQGNTQALIDYTEKSRRWNMPAHYYSKSFKRGDTTVKVIFLDTTPFLRRAVTQPDIYPDAIRQDTVAQLKWLREELADRDADWIVVAAHHPLFSSRKDSSGQRADVSSHLGKVLAENRPDLYISGDVHCFEHFRRPDDNTDYVTCSSGAQAYDVVPDKDALFALGHPGFMSLAVDKSSLTVVMYDRDGKVLYEFTKSK